jgi:hypothetical protein
LLESVTVGVIGVEGQRVVVPSLLLAHNLGQFLDRCRGLMRKLDINPPASLFASIVNGRGAMLEIHDDLMWYQGLEPKPFDRDNLLMREVTMVDREGDAWVVLKPLLNELWQAAGLPRCFDYDDDGNWKPRKRIWR